MINFFKKLRFEKFLNNLWIVFSLAYLLVTVIVYCFSAAVGFWFGIVGIIPTLFIILLFVLHQKSIDTAILQGHSSKKFKVTNETFFNFQFPDYYQAIKCFAEGIEKKHVESPHTQNLREILHYDFKGAETTFDMVVDSPNKFSIETSYKNKEYFSNDNFWTINCENNETGKKEHVIIRLERYNMQYSGLSVASSSVEFSQKIFEQLDKMALEKSIYKNQTLRVLFPQGTGQQKDRIPDANIEFVKPEPVTEDEIVLENSHKSIIKRDILDFFHHQEALASVHLSKQKGLLFYGPPGTGKTYSSHYIISQLAGKVTTIILAGSQLFNVKQIAKIAHLYQPALLILEDVDLVFMNRGQNPYGTVMGDLMDLLDGFEKKDNIMFLLTTNSIESVEEAIKNRPGRISQCVRFEYPQGELRMRYLTHFLKAYNSEKVNLNEVCEFIGSVSQVFVKELINKSVLIGMEKVNYEANKFLLDTETIREAYEELTSQNDEYVSSIVGFG